MSMVIFEGADGVGKTTLAKKLAGWLETRNRKVMYFSFPGHNQGTLGELVYRLHHDSAGLGIETINQSSVQTLHIASHIDAIERIIKPALEQDFIVVLDRYWWSTYVYGLISKVPEVALSKLIELEKYFWGDDLRPTIFLLNCHVPYKSAEDINEWNMISKLYLELAEKEARTNSIEVLDNSSTVDVLFSHVTDSLKLENRGRFE